MLQDVIDRSVRRNRLISAGQLTSARCASTSTGDRPQICQHMLGRDEQRPDRVM